MSDTIHAVWCLVAEIPEEGNTTGTGGCRHPEQRLFGSGATVYCFPPLWSDWWRKNRVIGRARGGTRLITAVIPTKRLVNWHAELVTDPDILSKFWEAWDDSDSSRSLAETMANTMSGAANGPGRADDKPAMSRRAFDSVSSITPP